MNKENIYKDIKQSPDSSTYVEPTRVAQRQKLFVFRSRAVLYAICSAQPVSSLYVDILVESFVRDRLTADDDFHVSSEALVNLSSTSQAQNAPSAPDFDDGEDE